MSGRRRSVVAAVVFFAFTTPLGIAAHLISELAGLGWHDGADVVLSARHGYLAALAVVALGGLLFALRGVPRPQRRARVTALIESLPLRGRGLGFVALSFVAQFGFFALTQIGEGCPLCGGDILVGVVAAATAALAGAFAVALFQRRFLEFVVALWDVLVSARRDHSIEHGALRRREPRAVAARRSPFSFRYRPPPPRAPRPAA
jgi:hypothetical protein